MFTQHLGCHALRCCPTALTWAGALLWATWGATVCCAEQSAPGPEEPGGKPGPEAGGEQKASDELLQFSDLPVVISASRQPERLSWTSAPVSVVTGEDIHYGGMTELSEVLFFVNGVDALRIDRNRYAIGVRGSHDFYSARTLTLVNGRSAENCIFGGSEFYRLPVLLEDIERIEVVRGPGGATWGANAYNGVINIITKKPEETQGFLVSSTVNEYGETSSQFRWGAKKDRWTWRTSYGYAERRSSEVVIHEDHFFSCDDGRRGLFDGEANYRVSPDTRISFGAGYQRTELGPTPLAYVFREGDAKYDNLRAFARADHRFNDKMSGYLQWTGNTAWSDCPTIQKSFATQNEMDGQLNFTLGGAHHFSAGGGARWTHIGTELVHPDDLQFPREPFDECLAGLFLLDRWQVDRRLTFEGQLRADWYSGSSADWAGRLTVLYALDQDQRHTLRFGGARAFRVTPVGLRDLLTRRITIAPGVCLFNALPAGELDNEEIWSAEVGYRGRLTDQISLGVDGYWQRCEELVGFPRTQQYFGPFPVVTITPANLDGALGYGVETELAVTGKLGRLSIWYDYHGFETDRLRQPSRVFPPARHKAGATGRLFLPHQVTLNLNYKYTARTPGFSDNNEMDTRDFHRLDLTVSKKFAGDKFELLCGVQDVLERTEPPTLGAGDMSGHETPGRTFFARFQLRF